MGGGTVEKTGWSKDWLFWHCFCNMYIGSAIVDELKRFFFVLFSYVDLIYAFLLK
jgi:hypothetical protein